MTTWDGLDDQHISEVFLKESLRKYLPDPTFCVLPSDAGEVSAAISKALGGAPVTWIELLIDETRTIEFHIKVEDEDLWMLGHVAERVSAYATPVTHVRVVQSQPIRKTAWEMLISETD